MNPEFLEHVRQRCHITEEGCWLFRGALNASGHPAFKGGSGRRQVWQAAKGSLQRNLLVTPKCLNPSCLCPDHLVLTTKSVVSTKANQSIAIRSMKAMTSARYARSKGKLTMEKARAIRASSATCKELGEEYGVHFSLISAVRVGKVWRETLVNPFSGLGAR